VCHSFKYYALFRLLFPNICAVYLLNWVLCWFQYLLREMFYSLDGFSVFIFFHVLWYSVSASILGLHFLSVERVQPCTSLSSLLLFMLLAFNLYLNLNCLWSCCDLYTYVSILPWWTLLTCCVNNLSYVENVHCHIFLWRLVTNSLTYILTVSVWCFQSNGTPRCSHSIHKDLLGFHWSSRTRVGKVSALCARCRAFDVTEG